MKVTTQQVRKAAQNRQSMILVNVDGVTVGFVGKYPTTKTEQCPWQAFGLATGTEPAPLLGSFYEKDGKQKAVDAVLAEPTRVPADHNPPVYYRAK
jgi:hypothetical protein